ncbi:hypothetical protein [uncultured Lacinutrix sp.]|nr:hypothetical protein [uncultured Lacinutrix sp.]
MQSYRHPIHKEPITDIEINIYIYLIIIILVTLIIAFIKSYFPNSNNGDD